MLIDHEYQADVAKQFNIKPIVVSVLVNKAKKNQSFLKELCAKREAHEHKILTIENVVNEMNENKIFIRSSSYVANAIRHWHDIIVKPNLITNTMKANMGMKYKKVKNISLH